MAIKIIRLEDETYLHVQYPGQTSPQDCYIELDLEGETLSANYNAEVGNAVPLAVYHGRRRRYTIPALTATAANALMEELLPLMEKLAADTHITWDGRNNIACLGEDAVAAEDEIDEKLYQIEYTLGDSDMISVWDADEYFGGWTDEELGIYPGCNLDTIKEELLAEHQYCDATGGPLVIQGLTQFLQNRLEGMEEDTE